MMQQRCCLFIKRNYHKKNTTRACALTWAVKFSFPVTCLCYIVQGKADEEHRQNIAATVCIIGMRNQGNEPSTSMERIPVTVMAFASGNIDKAEKIV